MSTAASSFVRTELIAPIAPPPTRVGALAWAKEHLFGSLGNAILTLLSILTLAALLWPTIRFLLIDAVWHGSERSDCLPETVGHAVGAC